MTVFELYSSLDALYPRTLSCPWDRDGLMVCTNRDAKTGKILLALDATENVISYAAENGFSTIITHHPFIFNALGSLDAASPKARDVITLIKNNIAVMSFHTRLDAGKDGVNDTLAALFSLENTAPFGPEGEAIGRIGTLPAPTLASAFLEKAKALLGAPHIDFSGKDKEISRVALLGGGGKDFIASAKAAGADLYLTGEVSHASYLDSAALGLITATAGHYYTEVPVLRSLKATLLSLGICENDIALYPNPCEISTVK